MVTKFSLLKDDDMHFIEEVVALCNKLRKMEKVIKRYEVWVHDIKIDVLKWEKRLQHFLEF